MKASNGMGTISKLKGKRRKLFVLRAPKIFFNGKFTQKVIGTFETKKEAEMYRIAFFSNDQNFIKNTIKKDNKGLTFSEIFELWSKNRQVSEKTRKNDMVKFYQSKKLHNLKIRDIKGTLLEDYFYSLNLTNGTLNNLKSFWKNLWDFAILNDYAEKNYPKHLKLPNKEKGNKTSNRNRIFSDEEIKILWDFRKKYSNNIIDMTLLSCYTSLRASEVINIKIEDINLNKGYINVVESKTEAGIRKVPIANKILEIIYDNMSSSHDYLFEKEDGTKIKYSMLDDRFRVMLSDLGLSYHTFHDCRHTFISKLSNLNANKDAIIEIAGHTKYTTTENYIHKNIEELKEIVDKIN